MEPNLSGWLINFSFSARAAGTGTLRCGSRLTISIHGQVSFSHEALHLLAIQRLHRIRQPHNGAEQERFDDPRRHGLSPPFKLSRFICDRHTAA